MRPKRRILLIDVNEQQRSQYRYALRIAAFEVQAAGTAAEARAIAAAWMPDVVLAMLPAPGVGLRALLNDLHAASPYLPSLALAPRANAELAEIRASMTAVNPPMSDVIQRLKTLSARKRGPRKGFKKPVQLVSAADILAVDRRLA